MPAGPVAARKIRPVAAFLAMTSAPAMAPPVGSVTTPPISATFICANAGEKAKTAAQISVRTRIGLGLNYMGQALAGLTLHAGNHIANLRLQRAARATANRSARRSRGREDGHSRSDPPFFLQPHAGVAGIGRDCLRRWLSARG